MRCGDTCTQKHKQQLQQLTCGSLRVKLMGKWVWQCKHRPNTSVHMCTQRDELLDHLLYIHNIAPQITNTLNTTAPLHWPDMKSSLSEFIRILSLSHRRRSKKLALSSACQATSCPTSWHEANFATCLHYTYHFALLPQPLHTALVLVFVFVHSGSEVVNKQGLHTELSSMPSIDPQMETLLAPLSGKRSEIFVYCHEIFDSSSALCVFGSTWNSGAQNNNNLFQEEGEEGEALQEELTVVRHNRWRADIHCIALYILNRYISHISLVFLLF